MNSTPDLQRKEWSLTRSQSLVASQMQRLLFMARVSNDSDITASFGAILNTT